MNRFNKAILFGLVAAIFGASSSNCIVVEKNFEVISNFTPGGKQSIQVGETTTQIEALATKAIENALKDATVDKKLIYTTAFEETPKKTLAGFKENNKTNIATLYACWLIKVKSYIKIKAINAAHAIFGGEKLVNDAIINEFYKHHLSTFDFTQFATPCEKTTQSRWGTCKKIGYALLAATALAAGTAGTVIASQALQNTPKVTTPAAQPEMCWLGQNATYVNLDNTSFAGLFSEAELSAPVAQPGLPAVKTAPVAQPEMGWLGQPATYVSIDNMSFAELFPEAECPAPVAQPKMSWLGQFTNAFCKASGGFYCQSK